jgi:MFS family permease
MTVGTELRATARTTFESLTVRNYRLFAGGQLTRQLGVWVQFVAQDWLVLELTGNSAMALGVVTGLQFLPIVLLSLYGGKLADRYDKRSLLIIVGAGYSVLGLVMGVLVATGAITLTMVFVLAVLTGTANAIENPVRQSFVSDLVPASLLPNALGLASAAFNLGRIIGPALAGVGIWLVGLGPVFLATGVLYLVPMLFLLQMRPAELYGATLHGASRSAAKGAQPPSARQRWFGRWRWSARRAASRQRPPRAQARIRDGLAYVWQREDLLLPLALLLVVGMAGFNFQLTLSVLAKNVYATGAESFGLLNTALAVGALSGALVSGTRRERPSVYLVIGAGAAFGLLEILVGLAPTFLSAALLLVPTGFSMIFFAQATNQRIQLGVDAQFRGRVMSLFTLVFLGTTPIGAPLIGVVSEHLGPRAGVWGGGAVSFLAALTALAWHLHRSGDRIRLTLRPIPARIVAAAPATAAALSSTVPIAAQARIPARKLGELATELHHSPVLAGTCRPSVAGCADGERAIPRVSGE